MLGAEVEKIEINRKKVFEIIVGEDRMVGGKVLAKKIILTTGGKSFPGTGSTGDGYKWAKEFGHTIVETRPALVPVNIKENWPKEAQGLSLKNVELSVFQNGKKKASRFGEMLFTHFGVSGPIVLDLSGEIGGMLSPFGGSPVGAKNSPLSSRHWRDSERVPKTTFRDLLSVKLILDLKPALDFQTVDKRLQDDFLKYGKKAFKNCLDDLLPQKMIPIIVEMSGIPEFKKANEITKPERQKLAKLFKSLEMTVTSLLGMEAAIITLGGVSLREIDAKTMQSKLVKNLFFAGEIINLHGPTGGYNLQICWSTGHLAGQSAGFVA